MTIEWTLFPVGAALRRWPCKPALGRVETRPGVYAESVLAATNGGRSRKNMRKSGGG